MYGYYKLKTARLGNYITYLLCDREGVPIPVTTSYITSEDLRNNTARTACYGIKLLFEFQDKHAIDIRKRIEEGEKILSSSEMSSLIAFASFTDERNGGEMPELVQVSEETLNLRFAYIFSFIKFLVDKESERVGDQSQKALALAASLKRIRETYSKKKNRWVVETKKVVNKQTSVKSLSTADFDKLKPYLEVTAIDTHYTELFGHKFARRNWLIVNLIYLLALRESDFVQLAMPNDDPNKEDKDAPTTNELFNRDSKLPVRKCVETHPDSESNSFKTLARDLDLLPTLHLELQSYINTDRRTIYKQARKTSFMFVGQKGPLSTRQVREVVSKVLATAGCTRTNGHCLRHTGALHLKRELNEAYAHVETDNLRTLFVERALNWYCGWSQRSVDMALAGKGIGTTTASKYTAEEIWDRINASTLNNQKSILGMLNARP